MKKYSEPLAEIIELETEDIILLSTGREDSELPGVPFHGNSTDN